MTDYAPPIKDMLFNIRELSGIEEILALDAYADFDLEVIEQVVEEAGKFAAEVLGPLNIPGDQIGTSIEDKVVRIAPGFAEAYQQYVENGWQGVVVSPDHGGMGMPDVAGTAAVEALQSACMSFSLGPMLTTGAIIALDKHGAPELKKIYLPKLATGEWTGTMNLTEPQAGSDLAAITTKAIPEGDHYRIKGSKIYITWGDHEATENIVHLVLARIEGAPEGVRGISMFLVPKYHVNDDGSIGERNDVFAASVEHKLGIHGSPTCVMSFGDGDGAVGYLVGEENKGLACMFTMMNHARIEVGVQGLSISERAYQLARDYALDRVQGRAPGKEGRVTIVNHADVRRMLLLMKAGTEAMRSVAMVTAGVHNLSTHGATDEARDVASRRLALLTPVVKGWMTEFAQELTSLGVQVHGGMGYVEETGAAQHMRDARILTIYEGTTGIQASDLVGRKILADEGREVKALIGEMRALDAELADDRFATVRSTLTSGIDDLEAAVDWLLANAPADPNVPGSASVNLLMLIGTVLGGYQMARAAVAISKGAFADDPVFAEAKTRTVDFYATHILTRSAGYRAATMAGADVVMSMPEEGF
ncbi:MAG: acyl-CoA dehydrogenase [Pseudomonadota bacterium]